METASKTDIETLDGASLDIAAYKRQKLLELFPEIRTEGDKIDVARLELSLGEALDVGKERYGLTWPGKSECFRTIQAPSMATLLPAPEKSVNFDATENLIIEGDNLEVLKLLQKPYLGKVKIIYIDPPYNTGNDFIYPDDYSESLQTYLQYTGQIDAEGRKFGTNTDAEGRFHSKWLNMMYPRLYLARNLLRPDGIIFVSCDDQEAPDLRMLMNDVFGEENLVAQLIWKKSYGGGAKSKHVVSLHEYIMCYAADKQGLGRLELPPDPAARKYYKFKDDKFEKRGPYRLQPLATTSNDERENLRYAIPFDGEEIWPEKQWQWEKSRTLAAQANGELVIAKPNGKWSVSYKQYLRDEDGVERGAKPFSVLDGPYTQVGSAEVSGLLGDPKIFPFPKPSELIRELVQYGHPEKDFIVLDFFAGSGSTAHAVLDLNAEDGGDRKFILVQLPEPTERQDYLTIADICEERVRRVITGLEVKNEGQLELDGQPKHPGFRVFKLAQSNVREWDSTIDHDPALLAEQLNLGVDHLRHDRSDLDIVYEVLLKSGYPLSANVVEDAIEGRRVYSVAEGAFLICLDRGLTLELLRAIAARKPERVLLLDEGFAGNDQVKANAVQIFTTKNIVLRTL